MIEVFDIRVQLVFVVLIGSIGQAKDSNSKLYYASSKIENDYAYNEWMVSTESSYYQWLAVKTEQELLQAFNYDELVTKSINVTSFTMTPTTANYYIHTLGNNSISTITSLLQSYINAARQFDVNLFDYKLFIQLPMISDFNECGSTGHCDSNADCTNTEGSYTCRCKPGFEGDGFTNCVDIDECSTGEDVCLEGQECYNREGSYTCTCPSGYNVNVELECVDIDECATSNKCNDTGTPCYNTQGSYVCDCPNGFSRQNGSCQDVDECNQLENVTGSFIHDCDSTSNCTNTVGSFSCDCPEGYRITTLQGNCADLNECTDLDFPCPQSAECRNNDGSFECVCENGLQYNGTHCAVVGECLSYPCTGNDTICVSLENGYRCECEEGYGISGTECYDIDECEEDLDACLPNAECYNLDGDYGCICEAGYTGDGIDYCIELTENNSTSNETCNQAYGPLQVDYISGSDLVCHEEASCVFLNKSSTELYGCVCDFGYQGNGVDCDDIDECENGLNSCSINAECSNEEGYYECECNEGFTGSGTTCEDIDECSLSVCQANSTCTNVEGSYFCTCGPGYVQSDDYCIETKAFQASLTLNSSYTYASYLEDSSSSEYQDLVSYLNEYLAALYAYNTTLDVDVQVASFSNGSVVVNHYIVFAGQGAHDVTLTSLNSSINAILESRSDPNLSSFLFIEGGFVTLKNIEIENDTETSENAQREFLATIELNPSVVSYFVNLFGQDLYNETSPVSRELFAKLERDLFYAYSFGLSTVLRVDAENVEIRPSFFDKFSEILSQFGNNQAINTDGYLVYESVIPLNMDDSVLAVNESSSEYQEILISLGAELIRWYQQFSVFEKDDNPNIAVKILNIRPTTEVEKQYIALNKSLGNASLVAEHLILVKLPQISTFCEVRISNISFYGNLTVSGNSSSNVCDKLNRTNQNDSDEGNCCKEFNWVTGTEILHNELLKGLFKLVNQSNQEIDSELPWGPWWIRFLSQTPSNFYTTETNQTFNNETLLLNHKIIIYGDEEIVEDIDISDILESFFNYTSSNTSGENVGFVNLPMRVIELDSEEDPEKNDTKGPEDDKSLDKDEQLTFKASIYLSTAWEVSQLDVIVPGSTLFDYFVALFEGELESAYLYNNSFEVDVDIIEIRASSLQDARFSHIPESVTNNSLVIDHVIEIDPNETDFDVDVDDLIEFYNNSANANLFSSTLFQYIPWDVVEIVMGYHILCDPLKGERIQSFVTKDNSTSKCHEEANCIQGDNLLFQCVCEKGYTGNGSWCDEIDICESDMHACHYYADCESNDNGYECECKDGFDGDGFECSRTNECEKGEIDCDDNASCYRGSENSTCVCNVGFIGDGFECTERQLFLSSIQLNPFFQYIEEMKTPSSYQFQYLSSLVKNQLEYIFGFDEKFDYNVTIISLLNGSVIAEFVVDVSGFGAHGLTEIYINETFNQNLVIANNNQFLAPTIIYQYLLSLEALSEEEIIDLLEDRNITIATVDIYEPPEYEQKIESKFSAYIQINNDVANNFDGLENNFEITSLPVMRFFAKLERDLFRQYSSEINNIDQIVVEEIQPRCDFVNSFEDLLSQSEKKLSQVIVFKSKVFVAFGLNNTKEDQFIYMETIRTDLRRAYINILSMFSKEKNSSSIANETLNNSKPDMTKKNLELPTLRIVISDIRPVEIEDTNSQFYTNRSSLVAEHFVVIQLPELDDLCDKNDTLSSNITLSNNETECSDFVEKKNILFNIIPDDLTKSLELFISEFDFNQSVIQSLPWNISRIISGVNVSDSRLLTNQTMLFLRPNNLDSDGRNPCLVKEIYAKHTIITSTNSTEDVGEIELLDSFISSANSTRSTDAFVGFPQYLWRHLGDPLENIYNESDYEDLKNRLNKSILPDAIWRSLIELNVTNENEINSFEDDDIRMFFEDIANDTDSNELVEQDVKTGLLALLNSANFTFDKIGEVVVVLANLDVRARSLLLSLINLNITDLFNIPLQYEQLINFALTI